MFSVPVDNRDENMYILYLGTNTIPMSNLF